LFELPRSNFEGRVLVELGFSEEATVKKAASVFCWSAILILFALPLRAQTGCVDSPEDPTLALALVGGAGALLAGVWRSRKR
jgi:XrtJ-associated TM-motif-TM protein